MVPPKVPMARQAAIAKRCACGQTRPAGLSDQSLISEIPSGNLLHNDGKSPFIVDFPMKNSDFP